MSVKKRSGGWKWLVWLILLCGLGYGGWRWFHGPSKDSSPEFKTTKVARGDLTQLVTANGQLSAVKNVTVGSQVSGIITSIKVDFNSRVTNGQVIAQIDPSTYQQNISQADAELANAQAALDMASLTMRRTQALRTNALISASEFDQNAVNLQQAQAVVKMREASLNRAKVDLERTTIYAPIDGIVISRVVDEGQTVAASFNAPTLFSIANDLRKMRIEAMVSEADVGGVLEGQKVNFSVDAFMGRQFRGEIVQVRFAPITNQNVVSYTTVVEVDNSDLKLRPGMTANASVVIAERHNVLRVPNSALRFRPPEGSVKVAPGTTNKTALANAGDDGPGSRRRGEGGGPGGDSAGGDGARPNRDEMRRRFESMTPEQREQRRAARAAGGGSGGGGMRGPGGNQDGPATRTVYVLDASNPGTEEPKLSALGDLLGSSARKEKAVLKPVMVKTGISDGTYTEVLEGLQEGDLVVTGLNMANNPSTAAGAMRPGGGTPFGGPFGGGGGGGRPR